MEKGKNIPIDGVSFAVPIDKKVNSAGWRHAELRERRARPDAPAFETASPAVSDWPGPRRVCTHHRG